MKFPWFHRLVLSAATAGCLAWAITGPSTALPSAGNAVQPNFAYGPNASPLGISYAEWSARWWQWAFSLPLPNHPGTDTAAFDVAAGQSGDVWFLAAPLQAAPPPVAPIVRSATIPAGKSIFLTMIDAEWSSLEGSTSADEQREIATWQADHIVPSSVSCTLDGVALKHPATYRFVSPQFAFVAPIPWLFFDAASGSLGGAGTAVGDGYFVFLKPLEPGQHELRITGHVRFTLADDGFDFDGTAHVVYHLTQL